MPFGRFTIIFSVCIVDGGWQACYRGDWKFFQWGSPLGASGSLGVGRWVETSSF